MVWTRKEKKEYAPIKNSKIRKIYRNAGLVDADPEQRAKYLAETYLSLGMTDHDVIMRTAKEEGRAKALNLLEQMAVAA